MKQLIVRILYEFFSKNDDFSNFSQNGWIFKFLAKKTIFHWSFFILAKGMISKFPQKWRIFSIATQDPLVTVVGLAYETAPGLAHGAVSYASAFENNMRILRIHHMLIEDIFLCWSTHALYRRWCCSCRRQEQHHRPFLQQVTTIY